MRVCGPADTCRELAMSAQSLGVECRHCLRRVVRTAKQLRIHEDDHSALVRLPLVCSCGRCSMQLYFIEAPAEAEAFLAHPKPQAAA